MIAKCIELSEEDYNDLQDSMKIWIKDICKDYPLYNYEEAVEDREV
jgi:hypothetical protein